MNLLDAVVTEVCGEPVFKYSKWFVPVKSNCWGQISNSEIMFNTFEEASKVDVGYTYLT